MTGQKLCVDTWPHENPHLPECWHWGLILAVWVKIFKGVNIHEKLKNCKIRKSFPHERNLLYGIRLNFSEHVIKRIKLGRYISIKRYGSTS